jgi:predicted cupin superfamily sugar epimerase
MQNAPYWIDHLKLQQHPEGGFYKETYRSKGSVKQDCLPNEFSGERNFSTSIYFLLRSSDRSCFHRIKSDELWHYHAGSSLTLFLLSEDGLSRFLLGSNVEKNESLQIAIPANTWFGALVNEPESYVLSGCTVSPGFDFADFEIADRNQLLRQFPGHQAIIQTLT